VKTAVIYNPSAGRGRGEAIASAVELGLVKRGLEVELHATEKPQDATEIAQRLAAAVDIIVAVGGDGTINEVANGMVDARGSAAAVGLAADVKPQDVSRRGALLGIVPAGTVNVLALELGLPSQVERACDVIARGKTILLDLGRVNGRGFVLMTGAGVDALTVRNVDPRAKKRFKELAFVGTGLKSGLATHPPAFLVRVEGQEYRTTFFVAGNCRYYAGHLGLTPAADPTDGLLDLLLFTGTTRSSLAVFWTEALSGLHLRNPNVTCMRARNAELIPIDDEDIVWFQTDGELAGRLPATVQIDTHALEVLVP
jgi:diacylglycerol kinase (ATP)